MALVFDQISDEPQTHAFIIGVGGYPFLLGGVNEQQQAIEHIGLLKQLTSPPKSALAFRDGLLAIENHTSIHHSKSLGSIELLISPSPDDPQPGNPGEQFEAATFNNISNAYNAWKNRCDSHKENVAIFFFCGHGVEKMDHFLLAEDFGDNPNNPWQKSINFDMTRSGFHSCKADTQCFFVDACRQITGEMLSNVIVGNSLDTPNLLTTPCLNDLTTEAAAKTKVAHGPKRKPSYFTQALLKSLEGLVADNKGRNGWSVTTGDLAIHFQTVMGIVKPGQDHVGRCPSFIKTPVDLIRFDAPPPVELSITCNPDDATPLADLSCTDLSNQNTQTRSPNGVEPWKIDVVSGIHELTADFQNSEFQSCRKHEVITPLDNYKELKCLPI
ncbi:caspase family protein [Flavivirga algicola]|uniref:Caspase family protein n=1 Tax=Flavivirga algicola TaxID=2729136 RepID=A0ABX1RVR1_9FLAO|nr:caspase family protein [Flavivirga algicola]NMH87644.1 caspase family protein [Flavivirga algicola]